MQSSPVPVLHFSGKRVNQDLARRESPFVDLPSGTT